MDKQLYIETKIDHKCPLCFYIMNYSTSRYPKMICQNCANSDITDNFGNKVTFVNIDIYGGFMSLHKIDGKVIQKQEHICWIKNTKCYANEMQFGGIVIQIVD
jgi:hypothetical protein